MFLRFPAFVAIAGALEGSASASDCGCRASCRIAGKCLPQLLYPSQRRFVEFSIMTKPDLVLAADVGEMSGGKSGANMADGAAGAHTRSRTITRVDLAEAVYQQVGLSRKESALLVEMV